MSNPNISSLPVIKTQVLHLLQEIDDETTLLEIARAIHKRVLALNSPVEQATTVADNLGEAFAGEPELQERVIQIELKDEIWHATRLGDGRTFRLCTLLSKNEVERQMRVKEPQKLSWELSLDEARPLQKQDEALVDYWDERKGNITTRHFYLVKEYQAALADWRKYVALAKDDLTVNLRLSVAARAAIAKLEADGYQLIFPQMAAVQDG